MGNTVIHRTVNPHQIPLRIFNWNPAAKNQLLALEINGVWIQKHEIIQSNIAGKVGRAEITGSFKLIKTCWILPAMFIRKFFYRFDKSCHCIHHMHLIQFEFVFRG